MNLSQSAFRANGASRVSPLLNPDGTPNLAEGFLEAMGQVLGTGVGAADVISYIAGVVSHTGFTSHLAEELETPGIRVPFTAENELWDQAVRLGEEVIWLHSYGELFHDKFGRDVKKGFDGVLPSYQSTVSEMPETKSYDPQTRILRVGTSGAWHNVAPEVAAYDVGGSKILDLWFKFRQRNPKGRKGSPLDDINQIVWPAEWSQELTELLVVLTRLRALETEQASLLKRIMGGSILTKDSKELSSVKFGASKLKPKYPMTSTADQLSIYPESGV
ncbi:type ISP restriction/modification enzyme [Paenarthrobacter sp. NPDC089316]|uniref:type ISP restriction/modification enzyme n=1 Tax=unclassified Paenarthrobacter TaxID=2634190 RepID=UPI003414300D